MSRSKIFKGRPDRLLIDQRAILIKLPDFSDAPPLEDESDPDDFLINEDFIIEEEEELEAAPLRVFIGTANISKIEEDNSLVESGAMVWDLSAMVESPEDEEFELFDSFDESPNVASIQIGGGQPVVQTAVTPAASAWALDEADEEIDLSEKPSENSVDIAVGRIKLPLAIPEEPSEDSNTPSEAEDSEINFEEDSDEDLGLLNKDTTANIKVNVSEPGKNPSLPTDKKLETEVSVAVDSGGSSSSENPDAKNQLSSIFIEPDNVEVTDKIIGAADDLHDPPEPTSLKQGSGNQDDLPSSAHDTIVSLNDHASEPPEVVPIEETDEQMIVQEEFNFEDNFEDHVMNNDNHSVWIIIILLLVAVIVVLLLTTS